LEIVLEAGGIFLLRVIGNMFTTVRLVAIVRGQKLFGAFLAAFESLIFAIALGSVVTNLDNLWNLAAYCIGYAVGGYLGLLLEQRVIQRFVSVHIISPLRAHDIAVAVREAGFGATESWGQGADWAGIGAVTAVVGHQEVRYLTQVVHEVDPEAFVTMEELRAIEHGYFRRLMRHER
jgi:uncharacterized protein YebE (UPF0316 family)